MLSRKSKSIEQEQTTSDLGTEGQPFCSLQTEYELIRQLIYDDDRPTLEYIFKDEILENLEFSTTVNSAIFYSEIAFVIFTNIVKHFINYHDYFSKTSLIEFFKNKINPKEYEKYEIFLTKIFQCSFVQKSFKIKFMYLEEIYVNRSIMGYHRESFEKFKESYVNGAKNSDKLLDYLEERINETRKTFSQTNSVNEDVFENSSLVDDYFNRTEEYCLNPQSKPGILTGFKDFDLLTGGWQPGELNLFTGRQGQGKSLFMLNFTYNILKQNKNILFVSLEMPIWQNMDRLISIHSGLEAFKVEKKKLNKEELLILKDKLNFFKENKNLFWLQAFDKPCSSAYIDLKCRQIERKNNIKIDLIIVDPIYTMSPSEQINKRLEEKDRLGVICSELKNLAMKREIPIIASTQFNREGHKRHKSGQEADTMDLAMSDKLAYVTDCIFGIVSKDSNKFKLGFLKTRSFAKPNENLEYTCDFSLKITELGFDIKVEKDTE